MKSVNAAQFSNVTSSFPSPACLAIAPTPVLTIVMVPLKSMYASL